MTNQLQLELFGQPVDSRPLPLAIADSEGFELQWHEIESLTSCKTLPLGIDLVTGQPLLKGGQ